MANEFNKSKYINEVDGKSKELKSFNELNTAKEEINYKENLSYKETSQDVIRKKKKKKKQSINNMLSTMAATIAVVAAGVIILPAVSDSKIQANFAELYSTDSSIYYELELNNIPSESLTVIVYNDFTKREIKVDKDETFGEVKDLKANMYYKVALKNKNRTLIEQELRTKRAEEMPKTEFYSVTHECTCNIDGLFHFSMNFIDGKNIWSNFEAVLVDNYGNTANCEFTDDLYKDQTIDIVENNIWGNSATFKITCLSNGQRITLYEKIVQI